MRQIVTKNINRLLRLGRAAATIGELTRQKTKIVLPVMNSKSTVYLNTGDAAVRVVRFDHKHIEAELETSPPIAWRTATDYDDNGVYVVLRKRPGFGALATAALNIFVPLDAHLVLKMDGGLVTLDHVRGTLNIAPPDDTPDLLTDGIYESPTVP